MGAIYIFRRARLYRKISPLPAMDTALSSALLSSKQDFLQAAASYRTPPLQSPTSCSQHLNTGVTFHLNLSPSILLGCVHCVKLGNLWFALKVHILCDTVTYPEIRTTTRYHVGWQCIDAIGGTTPSNLVVVVAMY